MKIFYHIAGYAAGILALSLSVASCSREAAVPDEMGELEIEGKIYDYDLDSSDDGVEGMVVVLSAFGDDDGYCYDIGRDTTDASGFFSMRTVSKIEGRKFRLGVEDAVCSPTFTIINEYRTRDGEPVYHFDFYRINKTSEALDIGIGDYFYSGDFCIMEWPENIEELLPEETLRVRITVNPDQSRTLSWEQD